VTSGTRLAVAAMLFAGAVFAVFLLYGRESMSRREPDSPSAVAREMLQADNTVVGMVGAIRAFEVVARTGSAAEDPPTAALEARVVGTRDSGRFDAELTFEAGQWSMRRGSFTLSDGTTIPVAGSAGR
jgi:hypothetical protein